MGGKAVVWRQGVVGGEGVYQISDSTKKLGAADAGGGVHVKERERQLEFVITQWPSQGRLLSQETPDVHLRALSGDLRDGGGGWHGEEGRGREAGEGGIG